MRDSAACQFVSKRFNRAMRAGESGTCGGGATAEHLAPAATTPPAAAAAGSVGKITGQGGAIAVYAAPPSASRFAARRGVV